MHQIIKSKLFFPGFYQCSMFFSCSRIQRSFPTSLVAQGKGIQVHLFQQGPEQHWMRMSLFVDSKICMVSFKMNHVQRSTHVTWTLWLISLAYLTIHSSYQYLSQSHTRCRVKCSQTTKVKTWQNTTVLCQAYLLQHLLQNHQEFSSSYALHLLQLIVWPILRLKDVTSAESPPRGTCDSPTIPEKMASDYLPVAFPNQLFIRCSWKCLRYRSKERGKKERCNTIAKKFNKRIMISETPASSFHATITTASFSLRWPSF